MIRRNSRCAGDRGWDSAASGRPWHRGVTQGAGVVLVIGILVGWLNFGEFRRSHSEQPAGSTKGNGVSKASETSAGSQRPALDARDFPDLHAAFRAVSQQGGLLMIPPGDYPIEEPLLLSGSEVCVVGAGPATRIINLNKEGKPAVTIQATSDEAKRQPGLWRIEVANLRIQGDPEAVDGKTTQPAGGPGLLAERVNELYLHGLSIDHNGGHGIALVDCYEDPRICECIVTYNAGAGIYLRGCHDIVISANQLEENRQGVVCIDSFNLCMSGNNLDDHLGEGVVIENTYGSIVSANMIEECQGPAIVLDRDCYGITISANVLADNFGGAVDLRDAWGCAISANTFTINRIFGVKIGPSSGRITITGNNFSDSYIGGQNRRQETQNLATGIFLEGTADITISGNVFSGLSTPAVMARGGSRRLAITGNVVVDVNRGQADGGEALQLGDATEVISANNVLPDKR